MRQVQPRPATGAIIGRRAEQQDALLVAPVRDQDDVPGLLLVVADGMGGHAGGQVASAIAVDTFLHAYQMGGQLPADVRLRAALEIANRAIGVKIAERPDLRGMGCTLVAALVTGDRVRWVSVGDSLLLAIRDCQSVRLNADHSLAPELDRAVMEGLISRTQADDDPDRHVLLSALNGDAIELIDEGQQRLGTGTFVLLATDGLLTLAPSRIAQLGSGPGTAEQKIAALLAAVAADMPADQDNTSLAAVHCGPPSGGRAGRHAGRQWLALLLLTLAMTGGGYTGWLLTRADGPPRAAAPVVANPSQPVPLENPYGRADKNGLNLRPVAPPRRPRQERTRAARSPASTPPAVARPDPAEAGREGGSSSQAQGTNIRGEARTEAAAQDNRPGPAQAPPQRDKPEP